MCATVWKVMERIFQCCIWCKYEQYTVCCTNDDLLIEATQHYEDFTKGKRRETECLLEGKYSGADEKGLIMCNFRSYS